MYLGLYCHRELSALVLLLSLTHCHITVDPLNFSALINVV